MRRAWAASIALQTSLLLAPALAAAADGAGPPAPTLFDNAWYRVSLDLRLRMELADRERLDDSQAYTLRTRLGLGSKPLHGFSAFAEVESVIAFADGTYFDAVESPDGQTPIADPEETELNQLHLTYENEDWLGLELRAGRQRIVLDDARFVGNVGWRQNEQTFDAALARTSLGLDPLRVTYAWVEEVHRVFGNDGPPALRDRDSSSHLVNVSWAFGPALEATAFAYLLDFERAPGASSDSYGLRLTGTRAAVAGWQLAYAGSYAHQQDAGSNPVDYEAHYVGVEASVARPRLGKLGVGFERLSSDQGRAVFATPLATAHKFSGFADVFVDNGGPDGLRDAWLTVAPVLPCGFEGLLVYHHFWADEGGGSLGDELDLVLRRPVAKGLVALAKGAWFEGRTRGRADLWRLWLELDYRF